MRVKLILDPHAVRQKLDIWFHESMGFIKQGMRRCGVTDPRKLNVAIIARTQVGRPQVRCGGRTYFELGKPILDCDTKSHEDGIEINDYCQNWCEPHDQAAEQLALMYPHLPPRIQAELSDQIAARMKPCAILERGDGQSLITIGREKGYNKATFHNVVPCNGGLHARFHFGVACNEGFHDCKYGRTKRLLSKDKVPKHIPNMENDAYRHLTTHIREDYIGTLSYFLLDVKKPPPELLLDDHLTYYSQLASAGGVAAFESMRHSGVPMAHYMLAARMADGDKFAELEAYAFHVARALAHKPVEVRVLLLSLLSCETTHPKIAEVVKQTAFANWSGKDGCYQDADRAMEFVNRVQDERRSKFSAFESALEFTPALAGMLHAVHALDTADNGIAESQDPLRQSTINAANVIRKDLLERLGDDLTIPDNTNRVFHTGGAPKTVGSTAHLSHRPWDFIWRVARGTSVGAGRGSSDFESSDAYINRFIREHLWTAY